MQTVHVLSDSPVNQYKKKFIFHIVSHHLKYFLPDINNFTWNYSEPGHGKGAPDGVGGTLKRSADQAVAEGKDVTDLNVLKDVLSLKCPSIMLIEVRTAEINNTDKLINKSSSISTFPGTQKIRQLVFSNDELEFRTLSCFDCVGKCEHFHLGYYKTSHTSDKDKGKNTPVVSTRRRRKDVKLENDVNIPKMISPEKKNNFSMILEEPAKQMFQLLTLKWSKNYHQWQIGSLLALEKKCGKTIDFILPMYLPVTTEEELENWLQNWYVEQNFTQENLSLSACMGTTSTPSTTAPTPTGRAGARLKVPSGRRGH
ncbi:hypothetical protein HHI36_022532 [Cryptolaemus montrouzieri]|uniref:Uncharacterized protein n=1 Tax=Cryptolaemus montrouzieri TaxID=559131 RepID=A0ABD2N026_9CUCU